EAAARSVRAAAGERDLEGGERVFRQGARAGPAEVSAFVDGERERFGVEPICQALDVSASAYYERASGRRSTRQVEDERLLERICQLHGGLSGLWLAADVEGVAALRRAGRQRPRGAAVVSERHTGSLAPWHDLAVTST